MEEERSKLPLVIVLALGVVGAVIVAVYCFIGIWTKSYDDPKEENKTVSKDVGHYEKIFDKSLNSQVKEYADSILFHLATSDTDWIFQNLNSEYITYTNYNSDKLKSHLKDKGILGKTLQVENYTNTISKNNNRVVVLNIKTSDNTIRDRIVVTEYSPNNYSLSFDDFISYTKTPETLKSTGVDVIVKEQVVFTQFIKMNITIANNTSNNFILNSNKEYEMITLQFEDTTKTNPVVSSSVGRAITLNSGKSLNYSLEFSISDINNINYKYLILKDVKNVTSNSVEDIKLNF